MAISRDHLRGRDGYQPEPFADELFDEGIDVGERPHGARQFSDRDSRACAPGPLNVTLDLQREEGELRAVGRWLGVHAVRSTRDRNVD